MIDIESVLTI